MTIRLLTGATGFVGGAIALELLDRTEDDIYALVRGEDEQAAGERLRHALIGMAEGYGRPDLVTSIHTRARAIRGDITVDGCGASLVGIPRVDEVWHCAASLRYEEKHREEIEAQNVDGTRNVLRLARRLEAQTFNQVSTAYVAGSARGWVAEGPVVDPQVANNAYERSKIGAEELVREAAGEMRIRILRPSIVIGHSLTHHAVNWSGLYGFARAVLRFRRNSERKLGTFLTHARVRLLAEPDAAINALPIDYVARNAVTIGLSKSPETYFHLVNACPPSARDIGQVVTRLVGLREPLWVADREGFTAIDEALDSGMGFYRSYMNYGKLFDLAHTYDVCGSAASYVPMGHNELTDYFLHFLRRERGYASVRRAPDRVLHASGL
ncbi:SDR family oxidoreductase [Streptantibioticus ferralitis]|uniref:SDR family oxidoreductase n=1 Tax=Streptantibioticus ferralitis TaxID=236510 RepID=A0ABT5Z9E8_9ACTN|nr:SDR family oxidoreductase [Streptantibioticus ferralitis]MDF2260442.1 SDR family oxidoreductase [Streptantibioticus ferralitis]